MTVDTKALAEALRELAGWQKYREDWPETADAIDTILSALAEARDALEPFAGAATKYLRVGDDSYFFGGFSVGDLRRAASLRDALNEALKEKADG